MQFQPADNGMWNDGMWLGANDIDQPGNFTWAGTKTPLTYTNWAPNNPSEGDEQCVQMLGGLGEWNDIYCYFTFTPQATICEFLFDCRTVATG